MSSIKKYKEINLGGCFTFQNLAPLETRYETGPNCVICFTVETWEQVSDPRGCLVTGRLHKSDSCPLSTGLFSFQMMRKRSMKKIK